MPCDQDTTPPFQELNLPSSYQDPQSYLEQNSYRGGGVGQGQGQGQQPVQGGYVGLDPYAAAQGGGNTGIIDGGTSGGGRRRGLLRPKPRQPPPGESFLFFFLFALVDRTCTLFWCVSACHSPGDMWHVV